MLCQRCLWDIWNKRVITSYPPPALLLLSPHILHKRNRATSESSSIPLQVQGLCRFVCGIKSKETRWTLGGSWLLFSRCKSQRSAGSLRSAGPPWLAAGFCAGWVWAADLRARLPGRRSGLPARRRCEVYFPVSAPSGFNPIKWI